MGIEFFLLGVSMQWGPCMLFCAPMIIPYIAGTRKGAFHGFVASLIFSFFSLALYVLLAMIFTAFGKAFLKNFYEVKPFISFFVASFVCFCGILLFFGKEPQKKLCSLFKGKRRNIDILIFSLLLAVAPCAPLLAVFAYIAVRAESVWQGAFFGFCFGAGRFTSPILLASLLGSGIHSFFERKNIHKIFQKVCGALLIYIGVNFYISPLLKKVLTQLF